MASLTSLGWGYRPAAKLDVSGWAVAVPGAAGVWLTVLLLDVAEAPIVEHAIARSSGRSTADAGRAHPVINSNTYLMSITRAAKIGLTRPPRRRPR